MTDKRQFQLFLNYFFYRMPLEISISRDDLSPGYLLKPVDLNICHKPLAFRDRVNTLRTHHKGFSYQIFELEDSGLPQQGILPISARKTTTKVNHRSLEKDSFHCE